jgi:hypothetical protein
MSNEVCGDTAVSRAEYDASLTRAQPPNTTPVASALRASAVGDRSRPSPRRAPPCAAPPGKRINSVPSLSRCSMSDPARILLASAFVAAGLGAVDRHPTTVAGDSARIGRDFVTVDGDHERSMETPRRSTETVSSACRDASRVKPDAPWVDGDPRRVDRDSSGGRSGMANRQPILRRGRRRLVASRRRLAEGRARPLARVRRLCEGPAHQDARHVVGADLHCPRRPRS